MSPIVCGWMMARLRLDTQLDRGAEPMSASDVEESLSRGTVSLNSAGFFMAPLATICAAMLEAFQLPIWLNVYISEPGRQSSAPCHTDKQDVIAVQSTGSKRWRVFAPPSPNNKISADPWTRGKGMCVCVHACACTGRATIPDDIKADLLERIRKFLASN